jgi:hypothetical protein
MAFPASPSDNQVHKTGDRTFVYDSTLGVWDQVKEANPQETGSITNTTLGSGITGTLGSGVTLPAGHIIQTITNYNTGSLASTSSTTASFGMTSSASAITITSGNHVLVTMQVNIYSGGNYGGFVWMCRGVGPGNSSSDMARTSFNVHADCMTYVSGMTTSQPHFYNSTGGHSYGLYTFQLLDTQLARHTSATQPRYSAALGGHPSLPSIQIGGAWSYPCVWTLQEIQT